MGRAPREHLLEEAGIVGFEVSKENWRERRMGVYDAMAKSLELYLDLDTVKRYLGL